MRHLHSLEARKWTFAFSLSFMALGLIMGIVFGGFNTGIDFSSGFGEKFQVSPEAIRVSNDGGSAMTLSVDSGVLTLTENRADGSAVRTAFPASSYPTAADLAAGLEKAGLSVAVVEPSLSTEGLASGINYPAKIGNDPFSINMATVSKDVTIEMLRDDLKGLGNVNVQVVGKASDGIFQVRLPIKEGETKEVLEEKLHTKLAESFGAKGYVVLQSDYVGPKFSSQLLNASIMAIGIAIVLILIYIAMRFRISYALSSVIALFHDVIFMLSFILIFRLEVSTTTIAAVLTIIGYSLNNTIDIFDRVRELIREDRKKLKTVEEHIDEAVDLSLTRTVITSLTTLLAIVPLAIFSTGYIRLFAVNLTWGIIAGAYSSNYIAPALLSIFAKKWPIDREKEKSSGWADGQDKIVT